MDFLILGPLEVRSAGSPVALGGRRQRALLALLLLRANEAVSADALVDGLWGERPPRTAAHALQVFVSNLRKALRAAGDEEERIVTQPPGYAVRVHPDELDLDRFERLAAAGRAELERGQAAAAAASLREALGAWRGPPLADFAYEPFAQAAIARLEELRLAALEDRLAADLALGRHAELVGELEGLVAQHPFREPLRAHLMLALYRAGRQSEALAVYQATRRLLLDELGIDPKPALQELERAILVQDPALELEPRERRGPAGRTLTLLFTDIEGSTRLLERLGDRYGELLSRHRRVLRDAVAGNAGHEVDAPGDGFFAVFERARDAVAAAVAAQRALAAAPWPDDARPLVRMSLHTGEPTPVDGGYVGLDVHRGARICAIGHGGQVLLSLATAEVVGGDVPAGAAVRELGEFALPDLPRPERLAQLEIEGLPADFPALRVGRRDAAAAAAPAEQRSILVAPAEEEALTPLVELAASLAGSAHPHELIVARLISPSHDEAAARLGRATRELAERREHLAGAGVAARVAAFIAAEPGADLIRLASEQDVDLVLVDRGWGLATGGGLLDELVVLLAETPSDVAVWTGGTRPPATDAEGQAVLVPFGGGEHDWAALELGAWLASARRVPLRLLGLAAAPDSGRRDASRLLATASLAVQQLAGVAAEPLLVDARPDAILDAVGGAEIVVAGLPEDWRSRGLGSLRVELAEAAAVPTLLVRRGVRPGGLTPREGLTRFSWSLSTAAG